MSAKKSPEQKKLSRSALTIYGRFLQWVRFHYKINQTQQAEIMGTSQGTISNWQKGEFEASWQANVALAEHFDFSDDLRRLHSTVFLFGQGAPMPSDDPPDMPYGLASLALKQDDPLSLEEKSNIADFESRVDRRHSQGDESGARGS